VKIMRISLHPWSNTPARTWSRDEIMWGIPRRHGYSDIEDPRAHAGITQHAFPIGQNGRAICGNEPPKRSTSINPIPEPQLALASPLYNPICSTCQALLVDSSHDTPLPQSMRPLVAIPVEVRRSAPLAVPVAEVTHVVDVDPRRRAIPLPGPANLRTLEHFDRETGESPAPTRRSRRGSVRRGGTITLASGEPFVESER
jgi:hypothetical protein